MKLLMQTGMIAGFVIGHICLILAIIANLKGGTIAAIDAVGYLRFAGTIFLGAITLGVYNLFRRVEVLRLVKDDTAPPERPGPEGGLEG